MTTKPRAPMTFKLDEKPMAADAAEPKATPSAPDAPAKTTSKAANVDRQQVGARVTRATYRKLKAIAALRGETVQTLVEQAIDDFINKETNYFVTK